MSLVHGAPSAPGAGTLAGLLRRARGRRRPEGAPHPAGPRPDAAPPEAAGGDALQAVTAEPSVPALADGLALLGALQHSGYRRPPGLVRRADGQTIQVTPLLYETLDLVDGARDHAAIAAELSGRVGRTVVADDVRYLLARKARPLGLLRTPAGDQPSAAVTSPLLGLRLQKVITDPAVTRRVTAPFARLFLPPVVALVTLAFAAVTWWVLVERGLAVATREALYEPGLLLLAFGLTVLSAGFHEFGHAAACRYGGATPGAMGVGLYLVWPAFYTDVTDSYRLSRAGRLRVDLGGLYFNAVFAVATFGVWLASGLDALLLVIAGQLLQMLRQLTPFVRFDGYHILADLTGVPDLFAHLGPTLAGLLPRRRGLGRPSPLRPWARVVVTLWVLIVVPVLAAAFVAIVLVLPRVAATAWDSLGLQWQAAAANWRDGDVYGLGVRALSVLALGVPVLSMGYLLVRVVRRTVRHALRVTAGRPLRRALAVLLGVGALSLAAWAWWPTDQYRPIEASERGALLDALPVLPSGWGGGPNLPVAASAPGDADPPANVTGAPAPSRATSTVKMAAATVAPPPAPRFGPRPVLLVRGERLVPYEPGGATGGVAVVVEPPADWPFPFDRPPAPGDDDVQALAVNTTDGATLTEFAHALVIVGDGEWVEQRNEAYALARCVDCTTRAVAFQVVLIVGQVDVVVPQNIAVAVNYECERCRTDAVAVQLVASLRDQPDDDVLEDFDAVWAQLDAVEAGLAERTAREIRDQLLAVEAAILRVLTTAGTDEEDADDGDADGDADPGGGPSDEAADAELDGDDEGDEGDDEGDDGEGEAGDEDEDPDDGEGDGDDEAEGDDEPEGGDDDAERAGTASEGAGTGADDGAEPSRDDVGSEDPGATAGEAVTDGEAATAPDDAASPGAGPSPGTSGGVASSTAPTGSADPVGPVGAVPPDASAPRPSGPAPAPPPVAPPSPVAAPLPSPSPDPVPEPTSPPAPPPATVPPTGAAPPTSGQTVDPEVPSGA